MEKEARKKIGSLLIAGTILVSGIGMDKKGSNKIKEYVKPIEVLASEYNENAVGVYINNERIEFDVEPSIINDRVMVPMRKIFESLGSTIEYNDDTKTIYGTTEEGHKLEHVIGTNIIKIDNKTLEFDTNSLIKNDRTLVPIRFVGESLGADVYYYDENGYLPYDPDTFKDVPKKSVDIIKESEKSNKDKLAAIKEAIKVNPNLTQSERDFFMNEMDPFYQKCSKYLTNEIIEHKKNLSISYTTNKEVEGSYGLNNIMYYKAQSFEEKLASPFGIATCAHEYFHALQSRDITGYLHNYYNLRRLITEGGAGILEEEFFNGISYNYEVNTFRILCEVLGCDVMGYLTLGGNFRVFKAELQKYLKNTEKINKFCEILDIMGIESAQDMGFTKDNLDEFYAYIKKIYETKYGIEIENDRLLTAYLDFVTERNILGINPKIEGYNVKISGADNEYYFASENINPNYDIGVNQMKGNDYNTFTFWIEKIPKSERYIDNNKVKKLIK